MEVESEGGMEPKRIARLLGVVLGIVIVLAILLLNSYGVVKLAESIGDLWFIALTILATISFQMIFWPERFLPHSKSKREANPTSADMESSKPELDSRSFEKGLIRQSELEKITADLDAHYKGIIERMDQLWDYQPKDLGEQIFTKGTTPGPTFGPMGLRVPYTQEIPQNVDEDKKHLREFREPWEIYSKGRSTYADASNREEQTKRWVREYLVTPLNEVEPPCRLLDKFTDAIISRRDDRNRGRVARDFEAAMMDVQTPGSPTVQYPAIDTEVLDALSGPPETLKWTLQKARKLAELMNKLLTSEDLAESVRQKRQAWDAVFKNKNDFLTALHEKVIAPATNSHYQAPQLIRGICNDCCYLKAKQDLLLRV